VKRLRRYPAAISSAESPTSSPAMRARQLPRCALRSDRPRCPEAPIGVVKAQPDLRSACRGNRPVQRAPGSFTIVGDRETSRSRPIRPHGASLPCSDLPSLPS
jgi:hypothetical protein